MPTLSIKDVPEAVAQALRERARRHHRSLQGELMALVTAAVAPGTDADASGQTPAFMPARGATPALRAGASVTDAAALKSIDQIAREHAVRRARPVRGGPAAGAQVRGDRDDR